MRPKRGWRSTIGGLVGPAALSVAGSAGADTTALDYALQCQGCHLVDGRGGGDIPSLHGVDRLARLPGGREYLARVPGVANASIDDARLAALLTWVLVRFSAETLPEDFAPYRAGEIAVWRTPHPDVEAARAALGGDPRSGGATQRFR